MPSKLNSIEADGWKVGARESLIMLSKHIDNLVLAKKKKMSKHVAVTASKLVEERESLHCRVYEDESNACN